MSTRGISIFRLKLTYIERSLSLFCWKNKMYLILSPNLSEYFQIHLI